MRDNSFWLNDLHQKGLRAKKRILAILGPFFEPPTKMKKTIIIVAGLWCAC
jgi:hypothetical protein